MANNFSTAAIDNLARMTRRLKNAGDFDGSGCHQGNTILFVMDMNNGFAKEGALYSPRTKELILPIQDFTLECRAKGIPVVSFSDCHPSDSLEFKGYPPHCVEKTQECRIVDELKDICGEIIYKNSTNGIFCNLEKIFHKGYTNYIVVGCCTDICVYQFAVSLKTKFNEENKDVTVLVPMDLIDTYDSPDHNADLHNVVFCDSMLQNGVTVVRNIIL